MTREAGTNRSNCGARLAMVLALAFFNLAIAQTARADTPAFSVHKNGADQTVAASTNVLLTWPTEAFDTNNDFASNRFTPTAAGKYLIIVSARCAQPGMCIPSIYKNGTLYAQTQWTNYNIADQAPQASAIIDMNGAGDYVEAYAYTSGTVVGGTADRTYFSGMMLDGGGGGSSGGGGLPAGTIAAFASTTCPAGWTEYVAARGRFLRGIDNGSGVDPSGTRAPGHTQDDALQNIAGSLNVPRARMLGATSSGAFDVTSSGSLGATGDTQAGLGVTFDASRVARTSTETRPKNVAVIFCEYSGSGGGGGGSSQWADGSAGAISYSGGNVGIGTTTPTAKLEVNGMLGITQEFITNSGPSTGYKGLHLINTDNNKQWQIMMRAAADGIFQDSLLIYHHNGSGWGIHSAFASNGNLGIGLGASLPSHILHIGGQGRATNSAWATSSDMRVKEDIRTISTGLDVIAKLRPVTFRYTDEYQNGNEALSGLRRGFIAQEVEAVLPDAVTRAVEKVGDREISDFRVLGNSDFVPLLVSAVKELKADNDNLRAANDNLRAELRDTISSQDAQMEALRREIESIKAAH